jgi:hypothetical protein
MKCEISENGEDEKRDISCHLKGPQKFGLWQETGKVKSDEQGGSERVPKKHARKASYGETEKRQRVTISGGQSCEGHGGEGANGAQADEGCGSANLGSERSCTGADVRETAAKETHDTDLAERLDEAEKIGRCREAWERHQNEATTRLSREGKGYEDYSGDHDTDGSGDNLHALGHSGGKRRENEARSIPAEDGSACTLLYTAAAQVSRWRFEYVANREVADIKMMYDEGVEMRSSVLRARDGSRVITIEVADLSESDSKRAARGATGTVCQTTQDGSSTRSTLEENGKASTVQGGEHDWEEAFRKEMTDLVEAQGPVWGVFWRGEQLRKIPQGTRVNIRVMGTRGTRPTEAGPPLFVHVGEEAIKWAVKLVASFLGTAMRMDEFGEWRIDAAHVMSQGSIGYEEHME